MISIIIPVLNEAKTLAEFLSYLTENISDKYKVEIILVDGGSLDKTVAIINKFAESSSIPVQLISSEKSRAKQMNLGSRKATGEILYFLHADSYPPKNFDIYINSEVKKGNPAGCFRMKFNTNQWGLKITSWFTRFNWRVCRGGDQSQFITKHLFEEIGGFDEKYIIYEDNILIKELYNRNKYVVIPHTLTTSARLYNEKGVWTLQYHFLMIHLKKWMGANAEELHKYYLKNIKA
ncbi:TIGR04283 family arsenosugar biosynthesis glycosyltransferase [Aequorivita sp. Q41]|uniref:TIGR04283 family arsenosugar biosynthesis glycosyltransferase n=1 Tax=Aequorivita sp. Q41 TaxID=3153300 RepID=UPI003242205D